MPGLRGRIQCGRDAVSLSGRIGEPAASLTTRWTPTSLPRRSGCSIAADHRPELRSDLCAGRKDLVRRPCMCKGRETLGTRQRSRAGVSYIGDLESDAVVNGRPKSTGAALKAFPSNRSRKEPGRSCAGWPTALGARVRTRHLNDEDRTEISTVRCTSQKRPTKRRGDHSRRDCSGQAPRWGSSSPAYRDDRMPTR